MPGMLVQIMQRCVMLNVPPGAFRGSTLSNPKCPIVLKIKEEIHDTRSYALFTRMFVCIFCPKAMLKHLVSRLGRNLRHGVSTLHLLMFSPSFFSCTFLPAFSVFLKKHTYKHLDDDGRDRMWWILTHPTVHSPVQPLLIIDHGWMLFPMRAPNLPHTPVYSTQSEESFIRQHFCLLYKL